MNLYWIAIVFQIIEIVASHTSSANIYSPNFGQLSADLTPNKIQRHFTRYETKKELANGEVKYFRWFRRTINNVISTLSKKIGISRDTLKERQGIGNLFVVPLVVYSITFLAIVAFQLQESLSRPSKFSADCVFNPWGPCSKTCGGGIQTRDFTYFAKNGGAPCIGPTLNYCNPEACQAGGGAAAGAGAAGAGAAGAGGPGAGGGAGAGGLGGGLGGGGGGGAGGGIGGGLGS